MKVLSIRCQGRRLSNTTQNVGFDDAEYDDIEETATFTLTKHSLSAYSYPSYVFNDYEDVAMDGISEADKKDQKSFQFCLDDAVDDLWSKMEELSLTLKIKSSKKKSMYVKIQGECLTELCRKFESGLKLKLKLFANDDKIESKQTEWKEMSIIFAPSELNKRPRFEAYGEQQVKLFDGLGQVDDYKWFDWMSETSNGVVMYMTISGLFCKPYSDPDVPNKSAIYGKMLNEKIGTDLEIFANDGTSIPCHRAFLMAQSSVFAAMFQNDFEESKTNKIKTDIPAKSLKPFLDYLYFYEISAPAGSPQIAIDLLEAGHKYDVKPMETKMEKIILSFPDRSFIPDEAVRLFLFVRNVQKFYNLKTKVAGILKCLGPYDVSQSEEFNKLFDTPSTSELAKDLTLNLMQ